MQGCFESNKKWRNRLLKSTILFCNPAACKEKRKIKKKMRWENSAAGGDEVMTRMLFVSASKDAHPFTHNISQYSFHLGFLSRVVPSPCPPGRRPKPHASSALSSLWARGVKPQKTYDVQIWIEKHFASVHAFVPLPERSRCYSNASPSVKCQRYRHAAVDLGAFAPPRRLSTSTDDPLFRSSSVASRL